MKQTAVKWLFQQLWDVPKDKLRWHSLFERAEQMEKKQIEEAWLSAHKDSMLNPLNDVFYQDLAEEYYNEQYGGNQ